MATWTAPTTFTTGQVLTSTALNTYLSDNLTFIKSQVETVTYTDSTTGILTDAGKFVLMNKGTACTYTLPLNASVAHPTGTVITIVNYGAGQVTLAAGGTTLTSAGSRLKLTAQWSVATLVKIGTDSWFAFGDLSA